MTMSHAPGPEAQFKAFLAQGRFMIQRSRSTGRHTFYPRVAIAGSGESDLEWVAASGNGTVHAITVNRGKEPYNIALIDLDEGPRMVTNVVGDDALAVKIGDRVKVEFESRGDGAKVPQFRRAAA